ncbi:MAG: glycoside hydrolase family 31 protein [Prevotella sp.]|nr:glycoside hydrolase family 31 protein [Prevotella sp.]
MKKKIALMSLTALLVLQSHAQTVEFYTPRTVRIVKDNGRAAEAAARKSLVVTATPQKVAVSQTKRGNATVYKSSDLTVTVENGKVTFADSKGNLLTSEGECRFTPIAKGPDTDAFRVKQTFAVEADEGIYGVGLLQNGKMSQRGENRRMEQNNLEDYAHFYQTIKGYGIYWDNYSPTHLVTPAEGKAGYVELESEVGKFADYYFIYGGNADGVTAEMRNLSGSVPMLPLWTYGFHQSRERYKSQNELLEVVHKYRDLRVPFDGIIQDWQYWGSNYNWNAMEFINPTFDRAQDMIDEVHRLNAHISISIWASFGPATKAYEELKPKGLLLDFQTWPQSGLAQWPPRMDYPSGVRCYDVYSKEARDIYWKNLSRLHKMNIDAWWMDSTDPDQMNLTEEQRDQPTAMGSYRSVRNAFPLMTVGGVYDSQRAVDDTKRVFILTRSYFAGQQRYGANTWSGDIGSSWESLRKQVPICLNYTLTANPNVNTDIGGFFAGSYNTQGANSGTRNPQYQELYVRWMQFGAFTPMMRSHGTEVYRELYYFGKEGEPVYDALVSAVRLRYRFLPYIYSQSWQVSRHNDSFMRALFMDFKEDHNTWNNNRQYLFGHNVLVCPVVDPLYTEEKIVRTDEMSGWNKKDLKRENYATVDWAASKSYEVYLPAGASWYDYWTGQKLEGGQKLKADAPLNHLPLYIKAGSILPLGPDVQYANENKFDNIDIVVYPGADAAFTLYEDEGDNYNYEKGQYSTIALKWNDRSRTLTIGRRQGSFEGMPVSRTFNVKVVGGKNTTVQYSGKALTVK